MFVAICCQLAQQLSGINGVLSYSTSIFTSVIGEGYSSLLTIGVGLINFVGTIISIFMVDSAGRRFLMLGSLGTSTILLLLIFITSLYSFNVVASIGIILFVLSFALGLGILMIHIRTDSLGDYW